jgi:hypothetical protein
MIELLTIYIRDKIIIPENNLKIILTKILVLKILRLKVNIDKPITKVNTDGLKLLDI